MTFRCGSGTPQRCAVPWARGFVIGTPLLVAIWMWLVASVPRVNGVGTAMVVLAVGGPIVVPIAIGIDHEIRKQNARAKLRDRGMPTIAEVTSLEAPSGARSGNFTMPHLLPRGSVDGFRYRAL